MTLTEHFELKERANGDRFWTLKASRPQWLQDAVRDAHAGESPNDWRYGICHGICEYIDNCDMDETDEVDTFHIADSLVDIYTHDRILWLAERSSRTEYCDEAMDYCEPDSFVDAIGVGQFLAIRDMAETIIAAEPAQ